MCTFHPNSQIVRIHNRLTGVARIARNPDTIFETRDPNLLTLKSLILFMAVISLLTYLPILE